MADPVRAAIVGRLLATPAVTSLLGAANNIFHAKAPSNATPPYIVVHRQAETDDWTFAGQPMEHDVWTVKAINRGGSASAAEDIRAAVTAALNDAPLTVTGFALLQLRRMSKFDFPEVEDGTQFNHCGAIFRVDVDPV